LEGRYSIGLRRLKPELNKRDNGSPNSVAWYAFGRSQGLDTSFGAKIIFSPMNYRPNFVYYDNPECTFYSGYCIKYDENVKTLLTQLNSERMQEFVSASSRDFRGGWKAYNKKIIENFEVKILRFESQYQRLRFCHFSCTLPPYSPAKTLSLCISNNFRSDSVD